MAQLTKMFPSMCSIFVVPHFNIVFYLHNPEKLSSPIRRGCKYTRDMSILAYTSSHAELVILQAFRACGNIVSIQIYLFIQIIQRDQGYGHSLVQVKPQHGPFILKNRLPDVTKGTNLTSPLPQTFQSGKYLFAYLQLNNA